MATRVGSKLVSGLLAVGCVAASTGCHTYRMITPDAVSPGTTVRAHLTPPGVARLTGALGNPLNTVEGEVVETGAQLHLLARNESANPLETGVASPFLRQRIIIGRDELSGIEERVLDGKKTAVVTTALVGTLTALFVHFMWGDSRGGLLNNGGDTEILSVVPFVP